MPVPSPAAASDPSASLGNAAGWRLAFEASTSPMWLEDEATGRLLAVNDAALRRYGYSRERLLEMRSVDLAAIRQHRADGAIVATEFRHSAIELDGRKARLVVAAETDDRVLAESEQRYRQLFETAADGYWEIDASGHFTSISTSLAAVFDIAIDDWLGKRLDEVMGVVTAPDIVAAALATMKQREPVRDFRSTVTGISGKTRWAQSNFAPFFDRLGQFQGYRGVSRDITAQVLAEEALRESEERARQLYEIASDYYFETDMSFVLRYVSPSYEKIFGIPGEKVIGKRLGELEGDAIPLEMLMKARAATLARQPLRDFVFARKDSYGGIRWISASVVPVFDENGKATGGRGVGADVTARVVAEQAARLAERRLQNAVAYISQAMAVFDDVDRLVAFNKAFDDLHGGAYHDSPVQEGIAFAQISAWQLDHDFFAREEEDEPALDLATLLGRYETEHEHTYRLADGRWMLVAYRRLPDGSKVGLWTDVTALKSAETERRALEAQLLHSQKLEALGTLAGGVAHEINNALVPVVALSKLVARKLPEDSRERRNLGTILTAAERSRDLVKQILAFSRKDRETRARIPIDLGEVLGQSLQMLRATVPSSIHLDLDIVAAPAPTIIGDANQLQQVIVNLINNAAQAIGARPGRISACLKPDAEGRELRLAIADTGCGMDEATLARIFEPFFTTKPVGEGTGLGLAVAHGIVEEHGGRITAESAIGRGTKVEICLPVAPAASRSLPVT